MVSLSLRHSMGVNSHNDIAGALDSIKVVKFSDGYKGQVLLIALKSKAGFILKREAFFQC